VITALHLENLKCHSELSLRVAPLTLLAGFNGSGKSTALQGLLLLSQGLRTNPRNGLLGLNGPLVSLGTYGEILNQKGDSRNLSIGVETETAKLRWLFGPEDESNSSIMKLERLDFIERSGSKSININSEFVFDYFPTIERSPEISNLIDCVRNTFFLSAVRGGTQEIFHSPAPGARGYADVGTRGELAAWWFAKLLDDEVPENKRFSTEKGTTLRRQLSAWGNELFPGFEATAQFLLSTGLVQLQLRTSITEDWRRPANVGYGFSYAFPIIVASLLAKAGQVLVVDSPEAHLHPRAQSRMGMFLAKIAAAGVRIVIETHSDHILNGVRLAVTRNIIDSASTATYFFSHTKSADTETPECAVTTANIDAKGGIDMWPDGFFDQSEKDLSELAGWK